MKRILIGLGVIALTVTMADAASAQTPPPIPPTTPCDGCGPSGTTGDGSRIWGYAEHHCFPETASATYSATYGVGVDYPNPVRFFAQTREETGFPGPLPDIPLATVAPGRQTTTYPVLTVPAGATVRVNVFGVDTVTGTRPLFYDGTTVKSRVLTCPCEVPVPTTVPTPTPSAGGAGGGGPAPTTVPAATTTGTSIARTTTRIPKTPTGTLPATGDGITVALWGVALICAGTGAWLLSRRPV